ncbi:MAG: hypothetical protein ACSLFA_21370 [Mycobacterium sp.]
MIRGNDDEGRRGGMRLVLGSACAVVAIAGCGSPGIVNTGEPWTPAETSAPPAQLPQYSSNAQLADASEFYGEVDGQKAYRFVTPSGRWQCVIIPQTSAGCRPATSAQLSISGAPTAVPGADGDTTAPDTIVIDRLSDVGFIAAAPDADTGSTEPMVTLPFGRVLAAAGFRCNVQEATGVSCGSESSGKGFTFSTDGYTGVYTDVPQ